MLLKELLSLLPVVPAEAGQTVVYALLGVACVGAALWACGARFSRGMVALTCTSIGAVLGMRAPQLYGWNVSGAGVAVIGAIAAGVLGFVMHRLIVGVMLGAVMATWAAIGTWVMYRNGQSWSWPVVEPTTTIAQFFTDLWHVLPPDVTRIAPWSAGVAMLSGVALALLWPRLAVPLYWSMAGVSLAVPTGLAAMQYRCPEYLAKVPDQAGAQLVVLGGLVAFGAVLQWGLTPKEPKRVAKPQAADTAPASA
jgi:hypothetical protein